MQQQQPPRAVRSVDAVTIQDDMAIVGDGVPYEFDIVPTRREELGRRVEVRPGAFVGGVIFGKDIELYDGLGLDMTQMTRVRGLYGTEQVRLGKLCIVASHVQSNGAVHIGSHCQIFGDIVGDSIVIDDNTAVAGNVVAAKDIVIGREVSIGGYVVSLQGSVAIDDQSQVFDVIAHSGIELGSGVTTLDPVIHSIDGEVELTGQATLGGMNIEAVRRPRHVNTNEIRVKSIEYETITNQLAASFDELK